MIHAVLNQNLSHALETLLAVSVLIAIVLMVRRSVSRHFGAGIVYLLWAIPVVRLFLPPLPSPVSVLNVEFSRLAPDTGLMAAHTGDAAAIAQTGGEPVLIAADPEFAAPVSLLETATSSDALISIALMTGVAVWIAGAVFVAARSLIAHARFMQTVDREAMPVSAPMAAMATRIAAETGLRRPPRIVASLISRGPFVTGLLRPVVVMPAWFEDEYTPIEARAALAHELMHVRRGDLWALQASELFVAAMWFNPLAYIARNAFRTDQEAACDADVLSRCQTSPHAYGATLVKAARLHLPEPVLAASRLPLTHALKERLTRMTYPAPSARRRMIGFGAALLFGASTLAITASVASAGEPKPGNDKEIRIESNGLLISDSRSDRQIVLLGDPMAKIIPEPHSPPEVDALRSQIDIDVAELTGPDMMGRVIDWHESAGWDEFEAVMDEITDLHDSTVEETIDDENGERTITRIRINGKDMTPDERDALVAKLEAKAAEMEAKIAVREAEIEAHEANIESHMEILEHRIEANGEEIERIMEERFGADFEDRVERQSELIERLVEACESAELTKGETRIIEEGDVDGEMVRLACIEGGRDRLKAAETRAAVESHPGITQAEKDAFCDAADGEKRKRVMVFRSGSIDAPEPPAAPEAPEPPSTDELDGE